MNFGRIQEYYRPTSCLLYGNVAQKSSIIIKLLLPTTLLTLLGSDISKYRGRWDLELNDVIIINSTNYSATTNVKLFKKWQGLRWYINIVFFRSSFAAITRMKNLYYVQCYIAVSNNCVDYLIEIQCSINCTITKTRSIL